jgi:hypothetical protein
VEMPKGGSKRHQLEVKIEIKKPDDTSIELVYSDFRVIIALPTIVGLLSTLNVTREQLQELQKLATVAPKPKTQTAMTEPVFAHPIAEEQKGSGTQVEKIAKLRFMGDITNIEIWVPRNVRTL